MVSCVLLLNCWDRCVISLTRTIMFIQFFIGAIFSKGVLLHSTLFTIFVITFCDGASYWCDHFPVCRSFWGFAEHFKDQADALMNQLDAAKQKSLQGELSLSSSNNSLNNGDKPSTAGRVVRVRSASQDRGYESSTLGWVVFVCWFWRYLTRRLGLDWFFKHIFRLGNKQFFTYVNCSQILS